MNKIELDDVDIALRAVLLGSLHGPRNVNIPSYISNQMPRTYATKPDAAVRFWKRHGLHARNVDLLDVVRRRSNWFYSHQPKPCGGKVILSDSRSIDRRKIHTKFQWVITSPPYPGMRTYVADQWLRNWFVGGPNSVDYSENSQLGAHAGDRFAINLSSVWKRIDPSCSDGARIHIRIGALPSLREDPRRIIERSIKLADRHWKLDEVRSAGLASRGRRQAEQFQNDQARAVREYDMTFIKEG